MKPKTISDCVKRALLSKGRHWEAPPLQVRFLQKNEKVSQTATVLQFILPIEWRHQENQTKAVKQNLQTRLAACSRLIVFVKISFFFFLAVNDIEYSTCHNSCPMPLDSNKTHFSGDGFLPRRLVGIFIMTREHLKPNKNTPNQTPEINKANQVGSSNKKRWTSKGNENKRSF